MLHRQAAHYWISIHALLAESDCARGPLRAEGPKFLSTLSLRRATFYNIRGSSLSRYFYPRSPCGERPCGYTQAVPLVRISIHALLAESDSHRHTACRKSRSISIHALLAESDKKSHAWKRNKQKFLSTLSLRRATWPCTLRRAVASISIHALLAESDITTGVRWAESSHFYPRSPCGERQSLKNERAYLLAISIHALLAESDRVVTPVSAPRFPFLSTLSLRRATRPYYPQSRPPLFLSTLSLRRATFCYAFFCSFTGHFYPRSPCGERLGDSHPTPARRRYFYPRSPCGERR